jgi:hypothetical protein
MGRSPRFGVLAVGFIDLANVVCVGLAATVSSGRFFGGVHGLRLSGVFVRCVGLISIGFRVFRVFRSRLLDGRTVFNLILTRQGLRVFTKHILVTAVAVVTTLRWAPGRLLADYAGRALGKKYLGHGNLLPRVAAYGLKVD